MYSISNAGLPPAYLNAIRAAVRREVTSSSRSSVGFQTRMGRLFSATFRAQLTFSFGPPKFPAPGWLPARRPGMSSAPAGRGLRLNPDGFPKNSVRSAGGYTVVAEGKSAGWSIYGPSQKHGDKPMTRVWGDPHVNEKDGTRWDFTKDSDFRLPDGTVIAVDTTSETGKSVTRGLTLVNGADRVQVNGIDKNQPSFGAISHDGFQWRRSHVSANPTRDTFALSGSKNLVEWFKESGGSRLGLVTGAKSDRAGSYQQVLDRNYVGTTDASLRPEVGSPAWGNLLRSNLVDQIGRMALPESVENAMAGFVQRDHDRNAFANIGNSISCCFPRPSFDPHSNWFTPGEGRWNWNCHFGGGGGSFRSLHMMQLSLLRMMHELARYRLPVRQPRVTI